MSLRDFIPVQAGGYSALALSLLFIGLAWYCCLKLREEENGSRWQRRLAFSLAMMVVLATHPGLLSRHFVATVLLFAASGAVMSGTLCLGIHAFMLMYLPLAWPRLVGAFAMFAASIHVFLTMLSYAVGSTSPLHGAAVILEVTLRDVTIVAALVALVWFVVERGRHWRFVAAIGAWIEKRRPPTSRR